MEEPKKEQRLSLILIAAPNEPPLHSEEYQIEIKAFAQALSAHGMKFSSRAYMTESATGGGFSLGEFGIVTTGIAPLAGLIGAWLQAKNGRKVKVKFKDIEVEAATVEEAEKLIELAEKYGKKQ